MLPRKQYHEELEKKKAGKITIEAGGGLTITPGTHKYEDSAPKEASQKEANLISSELDYPYDGTVPADERLHAPSLDIDFPVECYESSTPGHYHLLIERPMTWKQYKKLLHALMKAGIIEEGYYKASIKKGGTFLRKKGIKKEEPDPVAQVMSWQ